jgi:hypothetical protein
MRAEPAAGERRASLVGNQDSSAPITMQVFSDYV